MNDFFYDNQSLLLDLANTEAGRFILEVKDKAKIVKLSPNSIHQLKDKKTVQAKFYARDLIAEKFLPIITKIEIANEYKRIDTYDAFLHYSGLENKNYPSIHLTTFNVSGAGLANSEGMIDSPHVGFDTFANARAGTGLDTIVTGDLARPTIAHSGGQYTIGRYFCKINYTSLPSGATVISASFNLNARYGSTDAKDAYHVFAGNQSDTLVTTDWGAGNIATLWGTGSTPSGTTQHYEAVALNATGIAAITPAHVKYCIAGKPDYDNAAPGADYGPIANSAAGTNPPYVDVTYTVGGGSFLLNFI